MVWKESDTQRPIISGLGFHAIHDIIDGTGHVLRYGDDAKLGKLLISKKTNIKLQITVTIKKYCSFKKNN